jgi:hypothetical protein
MLEDSASASTRSTGRNRPRRHRPFGSAFHRLPGDAQLREELDKAAPGLVFDAIGPDYAVSRYTCAENPVLEPLVSPQRRFTQRYSSSPACRPEGSALSRRTLSLYEKENPESLYLLALVANLTKRHYTAFAARRLGRFGAARLLLLPSVAALQPGQKHAADYGRHTPRHRRAVTGGPLFHRYGRPAEPDQRRYLLQAPHVRCSNWRSVAGT